MTSIQIPRGPWTKIFEGVFQEHEMIIYQNQESFILTLILEEENEQITGVVVELYKTFSATGTDLDLFVGSLRRNSLLFTKHTLEGQYKYFLLGSEPEFVPFTQNIFADKILEMMQKIDLFSTTIKDVSKGYDVNLVSLHESDELSVQNFFSEPLMLPAMSVRAKGKKESAREEETRMGSAFLGVARTGEKIEEPLNLFSKTLISQGNKKTNVQAMHIMIESSLLSNTSAIIFDYDKAFFGLSKPTTNLIGLKKYKADTDPVGFPLKEYDPGQIHVNLNTLDPQSFVSLFGMGSSKEVDALVQIWKELSGSIVDLSSIYNSIPKYKEKYSLNDYQVYRINRLLRIIDEKYPKIFGSANNIDDITKSWIAQLGRASVINMSKYSYRIMLCLIDSTLKEILVKYKSIGLSKSIKFSIFIPKLELIAPYSSQLNIQKDIISTLLEMSNYGVAIFLSCEKEIDVSTDITKDKLTRITIIKDNDVGIKLVDRKPYRVILRPGFSTMAYDYPI